MNKRVLVCGLIGLCAASLCWYIPRGSGIQWEGDFYWWPVRAAKDLLQGRDPYSYPYDYLHVPYPLPAAIIALPFSVIPERLGSAIFIGLSSCLLAFALTKEGYCSLLVLLSLPFFGAVYAVQWSPLFLAALYLPILIPVSLAKPNIGLPIFLSNPTRGSLTHCAVFFLISLLFDPMWPLKWMKQVGVHRGTIPAFGFPGVFLLLAALKWREARGRLLLLASLVPQFSYYEALILWFIPETKPQLGFTVVMSWLPYFGSLVLPKLFSYQFSTVVSNYLPMLLVVLFDGTTSKHLGLQGSELAKLQTKTNGESRNGAAPD
jgi:hypothetical protein